MENHGTGAIDKGDKAAADIQKPGTKRATVEMIVSRIDNIEYFQSPLTPHKTYCEILIDNGFTVTGESAPADPANFDAVFGMKLAYDNAFSKLWPLFGFLVCEEKRNDYLEAPYGRDDFGTPLAGPSSGAHHVPSVQGTPVQDGYVPPVWRNRD